jgi:hypothetical protein
VRERLLMNKSQAANNNQETVQPKKEIQNKKNKIEDVMNSSKSTEAIVKAIKSILKKDEG